ncbi:hypothetical protein QUF49_06615 [Fictibacillus sp. b24]|nr:hypothetical protein [Fictibacillus sp. b24]MDM5315665.1 hypothetical protein [Fictibacillus sp. b24]
MKRSNVAHRLPRGKRAPETEINHFHELQECKYCFFNDYYCNFIRLLAK